MKHPPTPNRYRDAWAGDLSAARVGDAVRVAGWVHRRRDHGGLIFIDVRDRSGLVQLVVHPPGEAFALTVEARAAGLAVQQELAGRSLKGQLKQADRAGARYVAILGADGIRLRDMDSGEQADVESAAAAVARVIKGRHLR